MGLGVIIDKHLRTGFRLETEIAFVLPPVLPGGEGAGSISQEVLIVDFDEAGILDPAAVGPVRVGGDEGLVRGPDPMEAVLGKGEADMDAMLLVVPGGAIEHDVFAVIVFDDRRIEDA